MGTNGDPPKLLTHSCGRPAPPVGVTRMDSYMRLVFINGKEKNLKSRSRKSIWVVFMGVVFLYFGAVNFHSYHFIGMSSLLCYLLKGVVPQAELAL